MGRKEAFDGAAAYEIRIHGKIESRWSRWFDGMRIWVDEASGDSLLCGMVADQAALYGLMSRIRDLGLPLISLRRLEDDGNRG